MKVGKLKDVKAMLRYKRCLRDIDALKLLCERMEHQPLPTNIDTELARKALSVFIQIDDLASCMENATELLQFELFGRS